MRVALIGCGFVADMYMASRPNHASIEVAGVYDVDAERLAVFARHHGVRAYASLEQVLADQDVELVINLTNPRSHFAVSRQALQAGKHVYTEKPLAMTVEEGLVLVEMAESAGLLLASAPCTDLGEAAQTLWQALRHGRIGVPRLVYAELSDGPIPLMQPQGWKNSSGAPWPAKDEFEMGCTLEHAGYYVTWLTTFFGPVRRVSVFAHTLLPDKGVAIDHPRPDLTVGILEFRSGLVARLTCDIYASHDHRIRIFGDEGVLRVDEGWDMASPVLFSPRSTLELKNGLLAEKFPPPKWLPWFRFQKLAPARKPDFKFGGTKGAYPIDFMRGVAELVAAGAERRACRLAPRKALHDLEVVLALATPAHAVQCCEIESTFDAPDPMPWAR